MFVCCGLGIGKVNVRADDDNIFSGINGSPGVGSTLYNATNTYNYNGDNVIVNNTVQLSNRIYQYYNTNEGTKNNNEPSTGVPLITVLTHGFNSSAATWSNNGVNSFAYDEDSLFIRLKDLLNMGNLDANIYLADMIDKDSFHLYDITSQNDGTYLTNSSVTSITDMSKHIIIIFQSSKPGGYNYEVYEEFNYMLSKIVYDVKQLNNGVLPKINLIGHSRGGITNLMYALDHPDMVASMFSIGTPFFGSDTASTEIGKGIGGDGNGLKDIIDSTIYTSYYNRWKTDYTRLYSNINVHALGGYSDTDFIFNEIISMPDDSIENIPSDAALRAIQLVIKVVPAHISANFMNSVSTAAWAMEALSGYNIETPEVEALLVLMADMDYLLNEYSERDLVNDIDEIIHNLPFLGCPYYMGDLLVDLPYQIGMDEMGKSYLDYGFTAYTKCFREIDYIGKDKKLSNPNQPAVVHNLEARDEDFINYILARINLGTVGYLVKESSTLTSSVKVMGYNGDNLSTEVTIPSQINGKTVDAISYDLFKGLGNNITKITIPATVEIIERGAFIGLPNLREVVFAEGSALNIIGSEAFSGCKKLETFEIPRNVHTIEHDAFLYCDKLNLTVNSNNNSFSTTNGILFNKAGTTLIRYPSNKQDTTYTIPETVSLIEPYAFYDNKNLTVIHVEGRPTMRSYAFCNLTNLQEIHFYTEIPPYVDVWAFENTRFSMYVPIGYEEEYYEQLGAYANNVDETYPILYQQELECSITGEKIMFAVAYYLDVVTLAYVPTKEHYEFEGVYSQPNGQGVKYVQRSSQLNSYNHQIQWESTSETWNQRLSTTLYINWTRISEDVTCSAVANNSVISNPTVHITSGVSSTITAPTISGYTFNYWTIYGTNHTTATITIDVTLHRSYTTGKITLLGTEHPTHDGYITIYYNKNPEPESCVAKGTLITLADGSQVPVESLTGSESLLVWNLKTGSFDTAPILFIDSEPYKHYDIINLYFSDGTHVKVIDEHAFFDFNLNKYVYLRSDASNYIGHYFNKQVVDENGNLAWARVQLTNVTITNEYTMAYSPVTETHLCLYVNGMLSMPGGIEGLVNTFEVDGDTMQIDQAKYLEDVETYGLFTYEEFYELYPVPKYMFDAVDGANLKVALGKGIITYEELSYLIERYSEFFV
jgi:pimeloyl-ACP methyl ester carboxylesterase